MAIGTNRAACAATTIVPHRVVSFHGNTLSRLSFHINTLTSVFVLSDHTLLILVMTDSGCYTHSVLLLFHNCMVLHPELRHVA